MGKQRHSGLGNRASPLRPQTPSARIASCGPSGAVLLRPVQSSVLRVLSLAVTPVNLVFNVGAVPGGLLRCGMSGSSSQPTRSRPVRNRRRPRRPCIASLTHGQSGDPEADDRSSHHQPTPRGENAHHDRCGAIAHNQLASVSIVSKARYTASGETDRDELLGTALGHVRAAAPRAGCVLGVES